MGWFGYAISASILWGLGYLMGEKVLQGGVSASALMLIYVISAIPLYWGLGLYTKTLGPSIDVLLNDRKILFFFIVTIITYGIANYFIYTSISMQNASLAGMVEITYPLFTILFAYIFFREFHLNLYTTLGGALIFCGVVLMYWKG